MIKSIKMKASGIITGLILLAVFLIGIFHLYSESKKKIRINMENDLKSKSVSSLQKRMMKYGKLKFILLQGMLFIGLPAGILYSAIGLLIDQVIKREELLPADFLYSFIKASIFFTVLGLIYAQTTWNAFKKQK